MQFSILLEPCLHYYPESVFCIAQCKIIINWHNYCYDISDYYVTLLKIYITLCAYLIPGFKMKKYLLCLFLFFPFLSFTTTAQSPINLVTKAMKSGNAAEVAKHFDKIVDITMQNDQSTYSKSQAEMVLKNFFSKHPVKSFSVKHSGGSADSTSIYLIGDLVTISDQKYRLYLYFRQDSGEMHLQEIRFEQ